MADCTEGDTMVLYLILLDPTLISLITGLVIHSFIIVINVTDWCKGRSVTPVDHIITSLAVSRMCAQCALIPYLFVVRVFVKKNLLVTRVIVDMIYAFFLSYTFWLTSLLSIVFCLKISNLRTRLFLYLRRMIEQRTVHFILGSVPLSAFSCLLLFSPAITEETKGGTYNRTMNNKDCNVNYLYAFTLGAFIPLLFYYISSVLLFSSLYLHTRRMKMSGNLSINLETYYSAMTFVSITFIYNTIYFTGHFVGAIYNFLYCVPLLWLYVVMGSVPFFHSSYLIYRTAKLKSQMSKVLQNVIDFLSQRKDPEAREDIEVVTQLDK